MSLHKGLALAGAMLVVAIPAQPALLHAQSVPTNTTTIRTTEGVRSITLSALPGAVPSSRPIGLTPTVQSSIGVLSPAEVPAARPTSAVTVLPTSSNRRSTERAVPVVARTPAAIGAADAAFNSSIFNWLSGLVGPTSPSGPSAPVGAPPAPAAPAPVVSQPAPTPAPEAAPALAPAPETGSSPVSDAVGAVVDGVADVVNTVVEAVVDAAQAVAEAVAEVVSPTPAPPPLVAVAASQPAPIGTAPAPAQPTEPTEPTPSAQPSDTARVRAPNVAKVFTVSTRAELRAALTEAQGLAGAEIRVNPGNYGDWQWNFRRYPLGRVYVVAATSTKPVFRSIQANATENMSFHGLKLTGMDRGHVVQMNSSRNMSFTGSEISGRTEDRRPADEAATGIQVRFSDNVIVQDNQFTDVRVGMFVQRSDNVAIRYNRFHYIREGLNIAAVNDLVIRGNHLTHFYPRYDLSEHPDAMQFWTNNEVIGSVRVKIAENLIATGGKRAVQGLFAGSEVPTARHADWEVTRNVYYGSSPHGLSFSRIDNAKVWNNVIAAAPHADVNNSTRTATTSGGYIPHLRARFTANITAWNNILMSSGAIRDTTSNVVQYDNFDIIDNMGGNGQPWTNFFVGGRPDEESPPLARFLTRNPSTAFSRNAGITSPFVYGPRGLSKDQQQSEVLNFLKL